MSCSRLIPNLRWTASPLSPTVLPTTHPAQETPFPFSQACTRSWVGSESHNETLSTLYMSIPGVHAFFLVSD